MARLKIDLDMNIDPVMPKKRDFGIGCIGSGFIMRDVQLVAYNDACFKPVAIASRTTAHAREAIEDDTEPEISGADNLKTLALIDACYKSIDEERKVALTEII